MMPKKHSVHRAVAKDSISRKEKASGWARSSFTTGDLNKLRKAGLLPKKV
jgi:hypothetical protein